MNNCNDNQKLESTLYKELVSYKDNLHDLSHIIRRNLPKWAVHRLISNLQKNKIVNNEENIVDYEIQLIKKSMQSGGHGNLDYAVFSNTPLSIIKKLENLNCNVIKKYKNTSVSNTPDLVQYIIHLKW